MAKSKQITPMDQPTRTTIQQLFRDLQRGGELGKAWDAYKQAEHDVEELQEKLLDVPEYTKAQKHKQKCYESYYDQRRALGCKIDRVRRSYLARGLTPAVIKQINALIEEIDGE